MKKLNYHITMNIVSGYLSDAQRITPPIHIVSIYLSFLYLPFSHFQVVKKQT